MPMVAAQADLGSRKEEKRQYRSGRAAAVADTSKEAASASLSKCQQLSICVLLAEAAQGCDGCDQDIVEGLPPEPNRGGKAKAWLI